MRLARYAILGLGALGAMASAPRAYGEGPVYSETKTLNNTSGEDAEAIQIVFKGCLEADLTLTTPAGFASSKTYAPGELTRSVLKWWPTTGLKITCGPSITSGKM